MKLALPPNVDRELRPYNPEETLFYYDGPLLLWLPVPGRHLLAMAILEEPEQDRPWPFVVADMTEQMAADLMGNRITLLRAVLDANARYLVPDYGAEVLEYQLLEGDLPEDWRPGDVTLEP